MTTYLPLAPVVAVASPDQTGKNPGKLTCAFDSSKQGMPKANLWEIYHMTVTAGPPLGFATITIAGKVYSTVTLDVNGSNEWDPQQPAEIRGDQPIYFLWSITNPGTPGQLPVVTVFGRWDIDNPVNGGLDKGVPG